MKTYEYSELSPEIQARLIEEHIYINVDYDDWWSVVEMNQGYKLDPVGLTNVEIGFNLSAQWARIVCDVYNEKLLIDHIISLNPVKFARIKTLSEKYLDLQIVLASHRCPAKLYVGTYLDYTYKHIEKYIDEFSATAERWFDELQDDLLKDLMQQYDYLTSDEAVAEALVSMGSAFTSSGQIVQ